MNNSYSIQVLNRNGEIQGSLSRQAMPIEYICKGGFRFVSTEKFELEDRLQVLLSFPDEHVQEVHGRICYTDMIDDERTAYGFSILHGFYSLQEAS